MKVGKSPFSYPPLAPITQDGTQTGGGDTRAKEPSIRNQLFTPTSIPHTAQTKKENAATPLTKAILFNAQGLVGRNSVLSQAKFQEVLTLIDNEVDIISVVETWLEDIPTPDATVSIPGFSLMRCDRLNRAHNFTNGGGVALYIKDSYKAIEVSRFNNRECKAIAAKCTLQIMPTIIFSVYNPPAACNTQNSTRELLEWLLNTINEHSNCRILLLGDINLPDINWDAMQSSKESLSAPEHLMIELCDKSNLTQHNQHPSRETNANILDVVMSRPQDLVEDVQLLPSIANSDHFPLQITLNISSPRTRTAQPKPLNFWKTDWNSLSNFLSDTHWVESLSQCNTVEECNDMVYERMEQAFKNFVPEGK